MLSHEEILKLIKYIPAKCDKNFCYDMYCRLPHENRWYTTEGQWHSTLGLAIKRQEEIEKETDDILHGIDPEFAETFEE